LDLILRKRSSFKTQSTLSTCTQIHSKFRNLWRSINSREFLEWMKAQIVERLLSQQSKLLLLSLIHSHTYLETRRMFLAWFHRLLIKILTSEWQEMLLLSWNTRNQVAFILNSSLHWKERQVKWVLQLLNQQSS